MDALDPEPEGATAVTVPPRTDADDGDALACGDGDAEGLVSAIT
jgi:hypothetical protein